MAPNDLLLQPQTSTYLIESFLMQQVTTGQHVETGVLSLTWLLRFMSPPPMKLTDPWGRGERKVLQESAIRSGGQLRVCSGFVQTQQASYRDELSTIMTTLVRPAPAQSDQTPVWGPGDQHEIPQLAKELMIFERGRESVFLGNVILVGQPRRRASPIQEQQDYTVQKRKEEINHQFGGQEGEGRERERS